MPPYKLLVRFNSTMKIREWSNLGVWSHGQLSCRVLGMFWNFHGYCAVKVLFYISQE